MSTEVFKYNGSEICFQSEAGSVMVNATEMAKAFGSKPADWLRTDQSDKLIGALAASHNCEPTDLVQVVNGGTRFGTWMHEDVALMFAQWLSPELYIWCNDRIKELMRHGMTALPETVEAMIADPDLVIGLATKLKEERERNKRLLESNLEINKKLENQAPKVLFADCVQGSEKSILIADLAKILRQNGIETGQQRLFRWMRERGYLCSRGAYYNRPTQKAMEMGLFEVIERTIGAPDKEMTTFTTKVTGKGSIYFVNKFLHNSTRPSL